MKSRSIRNWVGVSLFCQLVCHLPGMATSAQAEEVFEVTRTQDGLPMVRSTEGREYPLIPSEEFEQGIEELKKSLSFEEQPFEGRLPFLSLPPDADILPTDPFVNITSPVSFSLEGQQTPIKDQLGRGSCWAFASVAALEASYRRKYGANLNLSEQYAFHIGKSGELYGDYLTNPAVAHENNSSYWGFQGNSGFINNLVRAPIPDEVFAPYQSAAQLETLKKSLPTGALDWNSTQEQLDALEWSEQHIPTRARWNAKYRPTGATNVFDANKDVLVSKLENSISAGREVIADFSLKWKFDAAKNAYDYDATNDSGGHVMLIVGYDRNSQIFTLKNSWGGAAFLRVTYNFMKNAMLWGTSVNDVDPLNAPNQIKAQWLGNWEMNHDGWRGKLVIRRFTDFRNGNPDAATKLGNYYRDGKRFDVNGYFADNGQHMIFSIADHSNRVRPGDMVGQRHDMYVFSWDPSKAAGKTSWQAIPFGSELSRSPIASAPARGFHVEKWIGTWAMNHDGWQGRLAISGLRGNQIVASYVGHDGKVYTVAGEVDPVRKHRITLRIAFPGNNQPFEILHHTWEDKVFSGTTQWGGRSFGVQGIKS